MNLRTTTTNIHKAEDETGRLIKYWGCILLFSSKLLPYIQSIKCQDETKCLNISACSFVSIRSLAWYYGKIILKFFQNNFSKKYFSTLL
jgi:hypothetical protein